MFAIRNEKTGAFLPHNASYVMPAIYHKHGVASRAWRQRLKHADDKDDWKIVPVSITVKDVS